MSLRQRLLYRFTQGRNLGISIVILLIILGSAGTILLRRIRPKNDYDCSDFRTQQQAQRHFNRHSNEGDIYGLDIDNDGIACESLR